MLHTYRSRCLTDKKNLKTQNFSIQAYKKYIEKSVLFSITGKRLIESRRGFLKIRGLNVSQVYVKKCFSFIFSMFFTYTNEAVSVLNNMEKKNINSLRIIV